MRLRQLASECTDIETCPSVWRDDDNPDDLVVVGRVLEGSPVSLGEGEAAVALRWQTVRDAVLGE